MATATEDPAVDTSHFVDGEGEGQAAGDASSPLDSAVEELRVDGTVQLGLFHAGGKEPTSATITLSGGKFELIDGQAYAKGDVIRFEGYAKVIEVKQRDREDPKTGITVSCAQGHTARITDLQVAPAD
jgi:hypothetical protein